MEGFEYLNDPRSYVARGLLPLVGSPKANRSLVTGQTKSSYKAPDEKLEIKEAYVAQIGDCFFSLFKDKNRPIYLEQSLYNKFKSENNFAKNCFIQSQMCLEKTSFEFIEFNKSAQAELNNNKNQPNWLYTGKDSFKDSFVLFGVIYKTYIQDKYKGGSK